jgi:myo-inositol 2-dehydrogenase / D-chiro-inositol 1-dehydrogenase
LVRIAVLGAGRIGSFRARVLSGLPEVDEVIVGNRTVGRAEALAREVGGTAGTIEGAVEFGPDAVFVSLATGLHAGALHRCLDAGLPIFCEKPIALTLLASSGGTYRDLHIHDFDLARWLTGMEIEQVYAVGSVRGFDRYVKYGDVDNVAILMTMSDGLPVLITGTRHNPRGHDFRMEVFGSEDSLSVGSDSLSQPRLVKPDAVLLSKGPYRDFIERFGEGLRQ